MLRATLSSLLLLAALAASTGHCSAEHIQYQIRNRTIKVRGVNLGSWLVGEHWMSYKSPMWGDLDESIVRQGEHKTMETLGHATGDALFDKHRSEWITKQDIEEIAALKLNTVRVPVGYWIVNAGENTTYSELSKVFAPEGRGYEKSGLWYLDELINNWVKDQDVAVMLSLHAHQGSQNGYDHSSPVKFGEKHWSESQENIDNSIQFATFLANRYKNAPAFLGLNIMNEPHYGGDDASTEKVMAFYKTTYEKIRADGNDCIIAVSPNLSQQSPATDFDLMTEKPTYTNVWHEWHRYYIWGFEGQTEQSLIDAAAAYGDGFLSSNVWGGNPILMGEWCMAGPGSAPFNDKSKLKEFGDKQLASYEQAGAGWTFWSWRHEDEFNPDISTSGWSMRQLIKQGHLVLPWL